VNYVRFSDYFNIFKLLYKYLYEALKDWYDISFSFQFVNDSLFNDDDELSLTKAIPPNSPVPNVSRYRIEYTLFILLEWDLKVPLYPSSLLYFMGLITLHINVYSRRKA
jgi:hypothetical protein